MKRILPLLGVGMLALASCTSHFYEKCPPSNVFNDWGVVNNTVVFGEYDSLFYLVNPIGNISDTVYYNGNYTDSYYHSDPVRIMLRYTPGDSINFNFERLYAVQTNPPNLVMNIFAVGDSLNRSCRLFLIKDANSDELYRCGPDTLFTTFLEQEFTLNIAVTNATSTAEVAGSQNYDFTLNTQGFLQARALATGLNPQPLAPPADSDSLRADSLRADSLLKTQEARHKH